MPVRGYRNLLDEIQLVPEDEKLGFVRGYIAGMSDAIEKAELTALIGLFGYGKTRKNIVILVHGIRTNAEWQDELRDLLENRDSNTQAIPIGYDFFHALKFWLPFTRRDPINFVTQQIRSVFGDHGADDISIVAHSFGTYVLCKILGNEVGISFKRILLCGSIVPTRFAWHRIPNLPGRANFLNDVGWSDIWPILAKCTTWGYGASGSFGYKCAAITDRFHDMGHSGFFNTGHMTEYWLPFLLEGKVMPSKLQKRAARSYFLVLLDWFPVKSFILVVVLIGFYLHSPRFQGWADQLMGRFLSQFTSTVVYEANKQLALRESLATPHAVCSTSRTVLRAANGSA